MYSEGLGNLRYTKYVTRKKGTVLNPSLENQNPLNLVNSFYRKLIFASTAIFYKLLTSNSWLIVSPQ